MMLTAEALSAAYEQHAAVVRGYLGRTLPAEAVEDVASEVWLNVVRDAPRYEDRGYQLSTWLYRIAYAKSMDWWRRQRRRPVIPLDALTRPPAGEEALGDLETRLDVRVILERAWPDLTHLQREAVRLRYLEDRTLAECADLMGISVASVKGVQHRALRKLRRQRATGQATE